MEPQMYTAFTEGCISARISAAGDFSAGFLREAESSCFVNMRLGIPQPHWVVSVLRGDDERS